MVTIVHVRVTRVKPDLCGCLRYRAPSRVQCGWVGGGIQTQLLLRKV